MPATGNGWKWLICWMSGNKIAFRKTVLACFVITCHLHSPKFMNFTISLSWITPFSSRIVHWRVLLVGLMAARGRHVWKSPLPNQSPTSCGSRASESSVLGSTLHVYSRARLDGRQRIYFFGHPERSQNTRSSFSTLLRLPPFFSPVLPTQCQILELLGFGPPNFPGVKSG